MSKAPASISQDAMTKGLRPWQYLLFPHDEVNKAKDMTGYSASLVVQPPNNVHGKARCAWKGLRC